MDTGWKPVEPITGTGMFTLTTNSTCFSSMNIIFATKERITINKEANCVYSFVSMSRRFKMDILRQRSVYSSR